MKDIKQQPLWLFVSRAMLAELQEEKQLSLCSMFRGYGSLTEVSAPQRSHVTALSLHRQNKNSDIH